MVAVKFGKKIIKKLKNILKPQFFYGFELFLTIFSTLFLHKISKDPISKKLISLREKKKVKCHDLLE